MSYKLKCNMPRNLDNRLEHWLQSELAQNVLSVSNVRDISRINQTVRASLAGSGAEPRRKKMNSVHSKRHRTKHVCKTVIYASFLCIFDINCANQLVAQTTRNIFFAVPA